MVGDSAHVGNIIVGQANAGAAEGVTESVRWRTHPSFEEPTRRPGSCFSGRPQGLQVIVL